MADISYKSLKTEELEKRKSNLERRMKEMAEDNDYDEAARIKRKIEPIELELSARAYAATKAAEAKAAADLLAISETELDAVVDNYGKKSAHDRHMLAGFNKGTKSTNDKEMLPQQKAAPSSQDKSLIAVPTTKSAHDAHAISLPKKMA